MSTGARASVLLDTNRPNLSRAKRGLSVADNYSIRRLAHRCEATTEAPHCHREKSKPRCAPRERAFLTTKAQISNRTDPWRPSRSRRAPPSSLKNSWPRCSACAPRSSRSCSTRTSTRRRKPRSSTRRRPRRRRRRRRRRRLRAGRCPDTGRARRRVAAPRRGSSGQRARDRRRRRACPRARARVLPRRNPRHGEERVMLRCRRVCFGTALRRDVTVVFAPSCVTMGWRSDTSGSSSRPGSRHPTCASFNRRAARAAIETNPINLAGDDDAARTRSRLSVAIGLREKPMHLRSVEASSPLTTRGRASTSSSSSTARLSRPLSARRCRPSSGAVTSAGRRARPRHGDGGAAVPRGHSHRRRARCRCSGGRGRCGGIPGPSPPRRTSCR